MTPADSTRAGAAGGTPIFERLERELDDRRSAGLFRRIPDVSPVDIIDLSTNSYLALDQDVSVRDEALRLAQKQLHGNCASRLVSQSTRLFSDLEAELASWKGVESSLLFVSGYAANVGILQTLCNRDTEVFSDRLNHASLVDGITLARAKLARYAHNDMADLARRLAASSSREKLVVTDSVFSMDGDVAPLSDICELAHEYGAMVMVDEAHATGIFGPVGEGMVEACGCSNGVSIRMGTLSKAIAGLGGFFAGSRVIRDALINNARSFIYSTALPVSVLAMDLAAVRHIRAHPGIGRSLLDLAQSIRDRLKRAGFETMRSETQIIPVLTGSAESAVALSRHLASHGVGAPAIRPPTVPSGASRVRLSIHRGLTAGQIDRTIAAFESWRPM